VFKATWKFSFGTVDQGGFAAVPKSPDGTCDYMRNLRICHLGKYYPPMHGGIENHVQTLARTQAELGHDVRVFCLNHESGPTLREYDGPIEVTRFGRAVSAAKIDYCPDLASELARLDVDVVHLQAPNPTMIVGLLSTRMNRPLVVTYQSDVVKQKLRGVLFRPLERLAYRRVRAVIATSPVYAEGSSFLRGYADLVRVVPLGIDLAPFLEPAADLVDRAARIRAEHPGPIWLGCGRLVYYKGFIHAIRALSRVEGKLFLVGQGPDRAALEAEARRLGVADRVIFLGGLPEARDLIPYYLAATAFWFPSNARSEAFGLVQVEAMACGSPVINTSIPHSGVSWVSRHEETGLTVPIDDPVALGDAANRLLREPGLRDRLGSAARRRALAEFNHHTMTERNLAVYREVLGDRTDSIETKIARIVPAASVKS
jgi:glycosyltransferase involved in cell wall biosynthesis